MGTGTGTGRVGDAGRGSWLVVAHFIPNFFVRRTRDTNAAAGPVASPGARRRLQLTRGPHSCRESHVLARATHPPATLATLERNGTFQFLPVCLFFLVFGSLPSTHHRVAGRHRPVIPRALAPGSSPGRSRARHAHAQNVILSSAREPCNARGGERSQQLFGVFL